MAELYCGYYRLVTETRDNRAVLWRIFPDALLSPYADSIRCEGMFPCLEIPTRKTPDPGTDARKTWRRLETDPLRRSPCGVIDGDAHSGRGTRRPSHCKSGIQSELEVFSAGFGGGAGEPVPGLAW